ncbi:hypothetical protein HDK77DRAFT_508168 [Phyllosticta capitalensis]
MSSSNNISCPTPFVPDTDYPSSKGYTAGRFCGLNPTGAGTKCCLPCPIQDWVYSDDFLSHLQTANWLGVASFSLICFLLISYLVLPPNKSGRHYLTIGSAIAVMFQTLGLFIPLGTKPDLCYDEITPNWQATDNSCAWSGALLSLGSVGVAYWVMLRAIWLNIRVCWDKDPGKWFMIFAIASGIALPVLFTALSVSITGVAYRVGMTCLPNHEHAMETLWVWQIIFSSASILIQLCTTSYCIYVYLRVLMQSRGQHINSGSYGQSAQQKPQTAWRRLRRLLLLQWRTITLTLIVTIETLYFVLIFWAQDRRFGEVNTAVTTASSVRTWSACLFLSQGNKNDCIHYTNNIRLPESSVLGSLILLGLIGMQHFILLSQPRLFKGWWELIKVHGFRRRGSDVPLTSLLPENAKSQRDSGTSALRSPTPNTGGSGGKTGNDTSAQRAVSPASKTGANITEAEQTPPKTNNSTTTTPTTATTKTAYLSANTTPTTPKTPATSLNLSSRPSFFSRRASSHTRSPSRGGPIARSLANTPTHAHDGYDEFDSDDVYGPDGGHAPPRTISHPYGFALPSERASTVTDPAERRRLARSGDIVDFDFQQYDHDIRNSRSSAGSFDEAARGNLRDSGSSYGASGIGLGISLQPVGGSLGTGPWNTPAAAHVAGRELAEQEGRGVNSPGVSNPLPLKNHPDYYAAFSSATDDWQRHRPSTPPPPPLPLNFSRRGRGNGPGFAGSGRGVGSATTSTTVPNTGGMHPTAAGQRKASWAGSSGAVSSVGSSLGVGSKERDSVGATSTGRSVSPFATGEWERMDPPEQHGVHVSDYAYLEAQQQQQSHRRPASSLLSGSNIALAPTTPPPSTNLPSLPGPGPSSPPHSPIQGSRTPASRTALATPLTAPYQHPYGQRAPYEHNYNHPSISPFSFQAHSQQQRLYTPPDSSSPGNKAAASTTSLSTTSSSSSMPPTPTPAAKTRSKDKRATVAPASAPHLSSGTSPTSPKIKLGRSATTAALSSNKGAGVANPHRLPSWARGTAETLGFKLSQPAVSEEGEELRDPQAIREAVRDQGRGRGGLGMHPVSPEPSEPEDVVEDGSKGEAAWRSSRFSSGSSTSAGSPSPHHDTFVDAPEGDRGGKSGGFLGVGSRRWSGGSWVNGKRRSGQSIFSSLSGLSASSATGTADEGQSQGQGVRKRSV